MDFVNDWWTWLLVSKETYFFIRSLAPHRFANENKPDRQKPWDGDTFLVNGDDVFLSLSPHLAPCHGSQFYFPCLERWSPLDIYKSLKDASISIHLVRPVNTESFSIGLKSRIDMEGNISNRLHSEQILYIPLSVYKSLAWQRTLNNLEIYNWSFLIYIWKRCIDQSAPMASLIVLSYQYTQTYFYFKQVSDFLFALT